jgi:hypothetical protein
LFLTTDWESALPMISFPNATNAENRATITPIVKTMVVIYYSFNVMNAKPQWKIAVQQNV